jgi:hypothetical protein
VKISVQEDGGGKLMVRKNADYILNDIEILYNIASTIIIKYAHLKELEDEAIYVMREVAATYRFNDIYK